VQLGVLGGWVWCFGVRGLVDPRGGRQGWWNGSAGEAGGVGPVGGSEGGFTLGLDDLGGAVVETEAGVEARYQEWH
jgi:hypothetical protein